VRGEPRGDDLRAAFRQGLPRRRGGLADVVGVALDFDARGILPLQQVGELLERWFRLVLAKRRAFQIEVQARDAEAAVLRVPCCAA